MGTFTFYIYIYAFSRRFYPKRLTLHSSYSFTFYQQGKQEFPREHVSDGGNETQDLCPEAAVAVVSLIVGHSKTRSDC